MVFRRKLLLILTAFLIPMQAQAVFNPLSWVSLYPFLHPITWTGNKYDRLTESGLHLLANMHKDKKAFTSAEIVPASTLTCDGAGELNIIRSFHNPNGFIKTFKTSMLRAVHDAMTDLQDERAIITPNGGMLSVVKDGTNNSLAPHPLTTFDISLQNIPDGKVVNTHNILEAKEAVKNAMHSCERKNHKHLQGFLTYLEQLRVSANTNTYKLAKETLCVLVGAAIIIGGTGWLIKHKYNQWKKSQAPSKPVDPLAEQEDERTA